MTRINCIDPARLTDQHLIAECCKEIGRVVPAARKALDRGETIADMPDTYRMGKGHVRFFYPRTGYIHRRHVALIEECRARGFNVNHPARPPVAGFDLDWQPTPAARRACLERLDKRLRAKREGWYRYRGESVGHDWYSDLIEATSHKEIPNDC